MLPSGIRTTNDSSSNASTLPYDYSVALVRAEGFCLGPFGMGRDGDLGVSPRDDTARRCRGGGRHPMAGEPSGAYALVFAFSRDKVGQDRDARTGE